MTGKRLALKHALQRPDLVPVNWPVRWPVGRAPAWQRFVYARGGVDGGPEQLWLAEVETATIGSPTPKARDVSMLRAVDGHAAFTSEYLAWVSLSPDGRHVASLSIQEGPPTDPFLDFNIMVHRLADGAQRLFVNEHWLGGLGKAAIESALFGTYVEAMRADMLAQGATQEEADAWQETADFQLAVDHIANEPALQWLPGGGLAVSFYLPVLSMPDGGWLGDELFTMTYGGLQGTGTLPLLGITGTAVPGGAPPYGPPAVLPGAAQLRLMPGPKRGTPRLLALDGRRLRFPRGALPITLGKRQALLAGGRLFRPIVPA